MSKIFRIFLAFVLLLSRNYGFSEESRPATWNDLLRGGASEVHNPLNIRVRIVSDDSSSLLPKALKNELIFLRCKSIKIREFATDNNGDFTLEMDYEHRIKYRYSQCFLYLKKEQEEEISDMQSIMDQKKSGKDITIKYRKKN